LRNSTKGFSLTELFLAVAIILIIAAIVIPHLLRSRFVGDGTSSVGCLRTLNTAEATYYSTYGVGYSRTLGDLGPPDPGKSPTSTAAGLIDSVLAGGSKSGYSFTYSPGTPDSTGRIKIYQITAVPIPNSTPTNYWGTNYYYTDQSGVIRQNSTTTATSTDSPIGG
jgi:prepilin-type N-terminal cleavage/methylation domain-containing protein